MKDEAKVRYSQWSSHDDACNVAAAFAQER
jgi:hypothetical protein